VRFLKTQIFFGRCKKIWQGISLGVSEILPYFCQYCERYSVTRFSTLGLSITPRPQINTQKIISNSVSNSQRYSIFLKFGPALCRKELDQNFSIVSTFLKLYFIRIMSGKSPMNAFLIDCYFKSYRYSTGPKFDQSLSHSAGPHLFVFI
jgi:hypothetical protein